MAIRCKLIAEDGAVNLRNGFDPLDLEIIDRVYEAAWAALLASGPIEGANQDDGRQKLLRQRLFALAQPGAVDFDNLYEKVLASYDATRVTPLVPTARPM
jgi:hypothetical protein